MVATHIKACTNNAWMLHVQGWGNGGDALIAMRPDGSPGVCGMYRVGPAPEGPNPEGPNPKP